MTGSDDWTARVWSVANGACETVLACHSGAVTNVEYCPADKGIVTGKLFRIHLVVLVCWSSTTKCRLLCTRICVHALCFCKVLKLFNPPV